MAVMAMEELMKGKLLVIEAIDGSGKETQSLKLTERLVAEGLRARRVTFPDYRSRSSALIRMYLDGEFGSDPEAVNPYAASTFYAVDRFASYVKEWGEYYLSGGVVVADRYTTSNLVHQGVKIGDQAEQERYLEWLLDLEYHKFALPQPDCVLFLDVPPEISLQLLSGRSPRGDQSSPDIHERDRLYLERCYRQALTLAARLGWQVVGCVEKGRLLEVEQIHQKVYRAVQRFL